MGFHLCREGRAFLPKTERYFSTPPPTPEALKIQLDNVSSIREECLLAFTGEAEAQYTNSEETGSTP